MIKTTNQIKIIKNVQFSHLEDIVNKEKKSKDFILKKSENGFNLLCFESISIENVKSKTIQPSQSKK